MQVIHFSAPHSDVVKGKQWESSQTRAREDNTFPVPPSPTSTSLNVGGALGAGAAIMKLLY